MYVDIYLYFLLPHRLGGVLVDCCSIKCTCHANVSVTGAMLYTSETKIPPKKIIKFSKCHQSNRVSDR